MFDKVEWRIGRASRRLTCIKAESARYFVQLQVGWRGLPFLYGRELQINTFNVSRPSCRLLRVAARTRAIDRELDPSRLFLSTRK